MKKVLMVILLAVAVVVAGVVSAGVMYDVPLAYDPNPGT